MKWKIIPFNLEMAEKIQAGKSKGRIVRKCAQNQVCEILEFAAEYQDNCSEKFLIVKVPAHDFERERLWIYHQDGRAMHSSIYEEMWFDLVLEVPDNDPQFKPFDKVLVRVNDFNNWEPDFYWRKGIKNKWFNRAEDNYETVTIYYTIGDKSGKREYKECVPYDGNEDLVGTTDKPKQG